MLMKRNRSAQKDRLMGDTQSQSEIIGQKHRTNSFFSIPGVFVGLNPKGPSDSDAVRSPTSPLDLRGFPSLSSPFRFPRVSHDVHHRSWKSDKLGLSIIDSLDDNRTSKVLRSADNRTVLFGSQMRIRTPSSKSHLNSSEKPNSLPVTNYLPVSYAIFPNTYTKSSHVQEGNSGVLFEIGETSLEAETNAKIQSCSLDSGRPLLLLTRSTNCCSSLSSGSFPGKHMASPLSSAHQLMEGSIYVGNNSATKLTSVPLSTCSYQKSNGSLSASEIEFSEDYTRVILHGLNPKTTHIFGDYILDCHSKDLTNFRENEELELILPRAVKTPGISNSLLPSHHFLSSCYYCKKKLEGKDIYMYRGEKAFCSLTCRSQEILMEEEIENALESTDDASVEKNSSEEPSAGIFIAG